MTPWTAACHASLSFAVSQSLLKFISIKLVMISNHVILCHPFLLLPSIFPSIRLFSNESILHTRWQKYWNFSFSISPSNEFQGWFHLGLTGLILLQFMDYQLEKEMATHSSVLAWRIPGTGEPGGLPSMGSHRVGHDWSDLAAAVCILVKFCLPLSKDILLVQYISVYQKQ